MNEQHNGTGEVLALDLGGTKIAGAVVHTDGRILYLTQRPTPAQAGAAAIIKAMADVVDELRQRCTIEPRGVGIGAAGVIDQNTAKVLSATDTLKGWAGTEIARELGACTQLPVRAVNDVPAHGLGEAKFGAGAAASSVLLVAVGTGIGGAFSLRSNCLLDLTTLLATLVTSIPALRSVLSVPVVAMRMWKRSPPGHRSIGTTSVWPITRMSPILKR